MITPGALPQLGGRVAGQRRAQADQVRPHASPARSVPSESRGCRGGTIPVPLVARDSVRCPRLELIGNARPVDQ